LHETDKFVARYRERIGPKAPSAVPVETCSIEQGKPSEPPRIPIAQLGFFAPYERHADMDMMRMFRLRCMKEKKACHTKLCDDISEFTILL
jgi:hypothetical protein